MMEGVVYVPVVPVEVNKIVLDDGDAYQVKVPEDAADAESVVVELPQVLPPVTVMVGGDVMVAVAAARAVVQVPLENST